MERVPHQSSKIARRGFIASSLATTAVLFNTRLVHASPSTSSRAESVVGELFESLSESQRAEVARGFDHPTRSVVQANWHIVKPTIGSSFYTKQQQTLAKQIVRELTSQDGFDRIQKQTEDDDGGLEAYSMAWFGKPSDAQFEWVLTGRHLTLRADGNSIDKVAFGGPIAYGHGEESDPADNLFYFQTQQVQKVFDSLDAKQRALAVVPGDGQSESHVTVKNDIEKNDTAATSTNYESQKPQGLSINEMTSEQTAIFENALASILSPYREEDRTEALKLLRGENGKLRSMDLAYFRDGDLKKDGIWDCWRIEGPNAVIHFRGAPHVHAFIHITG